MMNQPASYNNCRHMKCISINPYQGVDWDYFGQYKSNLHGHTKLHKVKTDGTVIYEGEAGYHESTGVRRGTFGWKGEKVDVAASRYIDLGYRIISFTDHTSRPGQPRGSEHTISSLDTYGIKAASDSILYVEGKEFSHVVLPDGSRQDHHHFLSYFNNLADNENASLTEHLIDVNNNLGFGAIAHPAPYNHDFSFYRNLFRDFPLLLMEAYNPNNGASENTAIWDRFLAETAPDKIIFAMANDDSYHISDMGKSWNTLLMPRFDIGAFRDSLLTGRFYFSVDNDGCALEKHNPVVAPTIRRIRTTDREIIIEANNCHEIKWITNGEIVHTGHVLSLGHTGLKSYVRAELTGEGTTYTQPFGLKSL